VSFVHYPRGDGSQFYEECPTTFWKHQQGCVAPNRNEEGFGGKHLFECIIDPGLIPGETCTELFYYSCEGYTPNILNLTSFVDTGVLNEYTTLMEISAP
jgi:hypothetical protein